MQFSHLRFPVALIAMVAASASVGWSQPGQSTAAAALRNLNNQVLSLHARGLRTAPAGVGSLRAEAAPVLERRAAALRALIAAEPKNALTLAFAPEVLVRLGKMFPQTAALLEAHGTWEGPVEYLIFDDPGRSRHWNRITVTHGGERLDITFAGPEPEGLKCNDRLRITGIRAGTSVAAADGTVTSSGTTAAATAACGPTGVQNIAVLLVTFPGVNPPSNVTVPSITDIFFASSGRSVDGFWREGSYGKTSATGRVFGWYTLDAAYTCDQYYQMRDAALRAADADVDFRQYQRVVLVFPSPAGCGWAGLANLGCSSLASPGDGTVTASTTWLVANYMGNRDQGVQLATHEGGHNLTLGHASTSDYGPVVIGPVGTAATLNEYGDAFSTMGSWNLGHYSVPHKIRMGWLASGGNVQTVESNGVYSLQPLEVNPAGLQGLKVRRGTGNNAWLWVEYRRPLGNYDTAIGSQVYSGALVHYEEGASSKTFLLDYTPETSSWSDPALAAGRTWVDPYSNVSLSIQSATASALTVAVNYAAVPCVRSNPTVTLSPANPSTYAGSGVAYTVTVANKDSSSCPSSTFGLSSAQPSGWGSALPATSMALAPGQSSSVTLTKTPPAGTAPAMYTVDTSVSDGTRTVAGNANCTVLEAPPALTASLSTSSTSYPVRSTVPITATVLQGGAPVAKATVVFSLSRSKGGATTKTLTTDNAGKAVWNYKANQADQYVVTAVATLSSQTTTAPATTFTVK